MNETITIHGINIDVPEPREGEIFTDAVLLVRTMHQLPDGTMDDNLGIFQGETPGIILTGMLNAAIQQDNAEWHRATDRNED